ncbi:MAG: hypothetical protein R3F34_00965 [Planctomycetota bacterium]
MLFQKMTTLAAALISGAAVVWIPACSGTNRWSVRPGLTERRRHVRPGGPRRGPRSLRGTSDDAAPTANSGATTDIASVLAFLEGRETAAQRDRQRERATAEIEGATPTDEVAEFLATNPILALTVGSRGATALLGDHLVEVGDELLGGRIRVHAVDRDGVVVDTETGRIRIPLRNRGARSSSGPKTAQSAGEGN